MDQTRTGEAQHVACGLRTGGIHTHSEIMEVMCTNILLQDSIELLLMLFCKDKGVACNLFPANTSASPQAAAVAAYTCSIMQQ